MLKPEIYLVLIISVITLFNESYAKGGKGGMNTGVRIYNINGPKSLKSLYSYLENCALNDTFNSLVFQSFSLK